MAVCCFVFYGVFATVLVKSVANADECSLMVKYGDVLRRFSSWISDSELGVNMDGLKEKILTLFKLPQNSALTLTYIDEDDDEVMLVDDDDLRDIVRQRLDLLRISVKLTAEKKATKYYSSGSSTPLKSPPVQKPFQCTKTALEPLCETLVRLSTNLASKEKFEQISEPSNSLRSSHCRSFALKDWFAGMSDVFSNFPAENAISPEPELDLVNPSSKKNSSASPSCPARGGVKLSRKDSLSKSCHQDYLCNGCGADPIYGPRFRSKVKEDYDLCILCFSGKENASDYIRIDRPEDDHHQVF